MFNSYPANRNVFACGHFVSHKVLKNYANFGMQVGEIVFAEIDSIEQDAPLPVGS